jgi:TonB family protein
MTAFQAQLEVMTTVHFMAEWALRSSVLIVSGALLLQVLRVKDPSIRWAAWTAMLCASLAIPALTPALPKIPLAVLPAPSGRLEGRLEIYPAPLLPRHAVSPPGVRADGHGTGASKGFDPARAVPLPDVRVETPPAAASRPFNWVRAALTIYVFVALALLLRLCFGLAMSLRLLRTSRATGQAAEGIEIRESERVATPVALGIAQSSIVLPADWRQWSKAKLDSVLAHERSHIRRRDPAVQLVSAIHRALLWHSPLSWFLHRRIVRTAEEACDDAALAVTHDRASYAEVLLDFMQHGGRVVSWQAVPMARYGRADKRIHRILDGTVLSRGVTGSGLAAILMLGLPLAYMAACASPQSSTPAPTSVRPTMAQQQQMEKDLFAQAKAAQDARKWDDAIALYTKVADLNGTLKDQALSAIIVIEKLEQGTDITRIEKEKFQQARNTLLREQNLRAQSLFQHVIDLKVPDSPQAQSALDKLASILRDKAEFDAAEEAQTNGDFQGALKRFQAIAGKPGTYQVKAKARVTHLAQMVSDAIANAAVMQQFDAAVQAENSGDLMGSLAQFRAIAGQGGPFGSEAQIHIQQINEIVSAAADQQIFDDAIRKQNSGDLAGALGEFKALAAKPGPMQDESMDRVAMLTHRIPDANKLGGETTGRAEFGIVTDPAGAEVLIDGRTYGPSPVHAMLTPGTHTYVVKQPGAPPYQNTVHLDSGTIVTKTFRNPAGHLATEMVEVRGATPDVTVISAGPNSVVTLLPSGDYQPWTWTVQKGQIVPDNSVDGGLKPVSLAIPPVAGAPAGLSIVLLNIRIDPSGRVTSTRVLSDDHGLSPQVMAAAKEWRFNPPTVKGIPVSTSIVADVTLTAPTPWPAPPIAPVTQPTLERPKPAAPALDARVVAGKRTLGRFLLAHGEFDDAIAAFREGLKLDPANAELHQNLAEAIEACKRENAILNDSLTCGAPGPPGPMQIKSQQRQEMGDMAEFHLQTSPPGAEVLIDGKSYGPSPVRVTLAPGVHTYTVKRPGEAPYENSFTVKDGQILTKRLTFAATATTGVVKVQTIPPGATVLADGSPLGGLTPTSFRLPVGTHTLVMSLSGLRPIQQQITVSENETTIVRVNLTAGTGEAPTAPPTAPAPNAARTTEVKLLPSGDYEPWSRPLTEGMVVPDNTVDGGLKPINLAIPPVTNAPPEALTVITIRIDPNGNVTPTGVNFDNYDLRTPVLAAAKGWKFEPPTVNGVPVSTSIAVKVTTSAPATPMPAPPTEGIISPTPANPESVAPSVDAMAVRAKLTLGRFLLARGEYDEAIATFQEGLKLDPSNSELRWKLKDAIKACQNESALLNGGLKCGAH